MVVLERRKELCVCVALTPYSLKNVRNMAEMELAIANSIASILLHRRAITQCLICSSSWLFIKRKIYPIGFPVDCFCGAQDSSRVTPIPLRHRRRLCGRRIGYRHGRSHLPRPAKRPLERFGYFPIFNFLVFKLLFFFNEIDLFINPDIPIAILK